LDEVPHSVRLWWACSVFDWRDCLWDLSTSSIVQYYKQTDRRILISDLSGWYCWWCKKS
jgi:hypothetical protein